MSSPTCHQCLPLKENMLWWENTVWILKWTALPWLSPFSEKKKKMFWLTHNDFDFLSFENSCYIWFVIMTHARVRLTPIFFHTGLSTTSLISATGRHWWRATRTSHSTTTSGTMWWCPGTLTTYTRSRSTHAPLHSTPMEPATWTSKVTAGRPALSDRFLQKRLPLTGNNYSGVILGLSLKCCWKVAMNTCQLRSI